jgi:hypothetical protein
MLYFCKTRYVRFAKQSLVLEFSVSAFLSHDHKKTRVLKGNPPSSDLWQGAKVLLHLRISQTPESKVSRHATNHYQAEALPI